MVHRRYCSIILFHFACYLQRICSITKYSSKIFLSFHIFYIFSLNLHPQLLSLLKTHYHYLYCFWYLHLHLLPLTCLGIIISPHLAYSHLRSVMPDHQRHGPEVLPSPLLFPRSNLPKLCSTPVFKVNHSLFSNPFLMWHSSFFIYTLQKPSSAFPLTYWLYFFHSFPLGFELNAFS